MLNPISGDAANLGTKTSPAKGRAGADPFVTKANDDVLIDYGSGVLSAPLRADVTIDGLLTQQQAIDIALKNSFGPDMQPGEPTATLRLVTTAPTPTDGSLHPQMISASDSPAWVLVWRDSTPRIHGPRSITREQRSNLVASLECLFVVVVAGDSGQVLNNHQICRKKS